MDLTLEQLKQKARQLRRHIIRMIGVVQKGHLGGSCSIVDVVTVLYFHKMNIDPKNPQWQGRGCLWPAASLRR
jgi:transketolase